MKKFAPIVLGCVLILTIGVVFFSGKKSFIKHLPSAAPVTSSVKPTSSPSSAVTGYCLPVDLDAEISTEGAAGSIYGTLTLKNKSNHDCQVSGMNFILPTYSVKNISIAKQGKAESSVFTIKPAQTLYSQVHFPNGPQCSSEVVSTPVSFTYRISPTDTVTFADSSGSKQQTVSTCKLATEKTEIQVWSLKSAPLQ